MFNTNEPLIVYKGKETEEELRKQLKHAEAMKNLLCKLTLPWDKYLPIIHKGWVSPFNFCARHTK